MRLLNFWKSIPKLPLSALIFYCLVLLFWKFGLVPSPVEIVSFLESLYLDFGLFGLFMASFLEGIVYLGLYFPGSFVIALAVFLSNGSNFSLLVISLVTALALSITSFVNYFLGRNVSFRSGYSRIRKSKRGLLGSMVHPNFLAFYFFREGLNKGNLGKVFWVPIVMIPYGFLFGKLLYVFADAAKSQLESPYFVIGLLLIWLVAAFVFGYFEKRKHLGRF